MRQKVAREAATLLYFGSEKEYKQAKLKAAANFGVHVLPSNLEVALELDQIAEETEGTPRKERLIQMRTDGLKIMKVLRFSCPVLIGSVWRGNIRRGSDIDIEVFHDEPETLVELLKADGLKVLKAQKVTTTEHGKTWASLHIYGESLSGYTIEIVARPLEETGRKRTCDTFGDEIKGLRIHDLENLLKEYPTKRFLPP
jgi:predicted nucleotidyltransferase